MNLNRLQYYNDSIHYCDKLLNLLENEKYTVRGCFRGEPLQLYMSATDAVIDRTEMIRNALQSLQDMQLITEEI